MQTLSNNERFVIDRAADGSISSVSGGTRPCILILSFSDLATDPRVNRQIRFLKEKYRVMAAGTAPPNVPGVEFIGLAGLQAKSIVGKAISLGQFLSRQYDAYYWRDRQVSHALSALHYIRADAVIANDIETLPLALRVAKGAPVIYDAHEYAPRQWENLLRFRLFHQPFRYHLCRSYIPQVDAMMTVCQSIAERYEQDTGVRPVIVTNAPDYEALEPSEPTSEPQRIRMVHHGGANRSRVIERMIETLHRLDERFTLDFLLVGGDRRYRAELERAAAGNDRIRFLDPVPMRMLPRFLNRYDVGVFLLPPTTFNYRYALPNKLFEFIQARLMVAVGPSPEMARVVKEHGCGVVADDFTPEAMAAALREIDRASVQRYKHRSHAIAREMSAERNRETLLGLVESVLGRGTDHRGGRRAAGVLNETLG